MALLSRELDASGQDNRRGLVQFVLRSNPSSAGAHFTGMHTRGDSSEYRAIFQTRGALYNAANRLCPEARATERALMLDLLKLRPEHVLCDVAAGGGYLAEGAARILPTRNIICVEPAMEMARGLNADFHRLAGDIRQMPLRDRFADRLTCLAALHHYRERNAFFRESFRILKPGGVMAVADVLKDTPPARFLNGPVDALSITGHKGLFVAPGELTVFLSQAGFENVMERHERYTWDFPDRASLLQFCIQLFGLTKGSVSEVEEALRAHLPIHERGGRVRLDWCLSYAAGTKL